MKLGNIDENKHVIKNKIKVDDISNESKKLITDTLVIYRKNKKSEAK